MRVGSLFSGYEGLGLAVKAVFPDAETLFVSDIDKGACKILAHRFPDVPNLGDISAVDWSQVGPVDILTGGFPCQDVSHAGRRAGLIRGETRTGLWAEMLRAIVELGPRLVVAENVRGLLSARADSDVEPCPWCLGDDDDQPSMRALGAVLADLADVGYDAAWCGLRAADVGAAHGRFRVFILAWPAADTDVRAGHGQRARRCRQGSAVAADADGGIEHRGISRADLRSVPDGDAGSPAAALLPTPSCPDTNGAGQHGDGGLDLRTAVSLMPTPRATDGTKGGPNQRGSSGDLMLPSAVAGLMLPTPTSRDWKDHTIVVGAVGFAADVPCALLPTPAVNDMGEGKTVERWDEWTDDMKAKHGNGNGHGKSLSIEAQRLLPTPRVTQAGYANDGRGLLQTPSVADSEGGHERRGGARGNELLLNGQAKEMDGARWGEYAAAIARWEHTLGRPAPAPTMTSTKGNPQLSPIFTEWLMGIPAGWITDVPGITRNEALKACGNGVVPQQGAAALRWLLDIYANEAVA